MVQRKKDETLKKFTLEGLVVTSHGFERIIGNNIEPDRVISEARKRDVWLISNEFLAEFVETPDIMHEKEILSRIEPGHITPSEPGEPAAEKRVEDSANPCLPKVEVARGGRIYAKGIESRLKIFEETDVTDKSSCEGKLEDFVEYFNSKYRNIQDMIRERDAYKGAVPIEVAKKYAGETTQIIVMIKGKRESRKGYRFLDVEDPTGELSILIPKDNAALNAFYDAVFPDEVIGVQGKIRNELLIASDIVQPDIPLNRNPRHADEEAHMVMLSDIHVGSNLFLEKEFNKFIDWLNLKGETNGEPEKVKYVVVAGDLVDGIGVYPNQEKELTIPDIYKQYDYLASLIERIPDYIEVVLAMGNHDAVRGAEPQPRLPNDIGGRLYEMDNVHVTGNPIMLSAHGVKTLVYHGTSMDTIIGSLASCTYQSPQNAMIEYLKRRYLVPTYGEDSIYPDKKDYVAIKDIPDIFHAGHVHTNGYATYRGVKVINSGTWQGRTKYQESLGHMPTPCRAPVINLQTHELSVMHFGSE